MKRNINLCNGNPECWKTAAELTDAEVEICVENIARVNYQANAPHISEEENERICRALAAADNATTEREYIELWVGSYGELVIG